MPETIWAAGMYFQDDSERWYRPGVDADGRHHLLVSTHKDGLDPDSLTRDHPDGGQHAHLHFFQAEAGSSELLYNLAYYISTQTDARDLGDRARPHAYAPNTPYIETGGVFYSPEEHQRINEHMSRTDWFDAKHFESTQGGSEKARAWLALGAKSVQAGHATDSGAANLAVQTSSVTSSDLRNPSQIFPSMALRHGVRFRIDSDKLNCAADELETEHMAGLRRLHEELSMMLESSQHIWRNEVPPEVLRWFTDVQESLAEVQFKLKRQVEYMRYKADQAERIQTAT